MLIKRFSAWNIKSFYVAIIQQWIVFNFERQPEMVDLLTTIALATLLPPEKFIWTVLYREQSIDMRDLMAT